MSKYQTHAESHLIVNLRTQNDDLRAENETLKERIDALKKYVIQWEKSYERVLQEKIELVKELETERCLSFRNQVAELEAELEIRREAKDQEPQGASEEVQRFAIDVEKMLCDVLGKRWRPSGMSIETLISEIKALKQASEPPVKPNYKPSFDEWQAELHPITRWKKEGPVELIFEQGFRYGAKLAGNYPQPQAQDALDAKRYRWLRHRDSMSMALVSKYREKELDAAIDAAMGETK